MNGRVSGRRPCFKAYFCQEKAPCDREVLLEAANAAGLDMDKARLMYWGDSIVTTACCVHSQVAHYSP